MAFDDTPGSKRLDKMANLMVRLRWQSLIADVHILAGAQACSCSLEAVGAVNGPRHTDETNAVEKCL